MKVEKRDDETIGQRWRKHTISLSQSRRQPKYCGPPSPGRLCLQKHHKQVHRCHQSRALLTTHYAAAMSALHKDYVPGRNCYVS